MQTVINIGSGTSPDVTSYEDAFGEYGQDQYYSEARGDGRRRRQAKKLERIANKKEVALARRDLKQSKQQAKIEQRRGAMASRQNIKTERRRNTQERKNEQQQYRQGRRDTELQSRQARRDFSKTSRVNRRNIGNEEDYEEPTVDDTQMGGGEPYYGDSQNYQDTQFDDSQNYTPEEDAVSEDGYGDNSEDDGYVDATEENFYEDTEEGFGFDGGDEFSHQESEGVDYIDIESLPIYKNAFKIEQNKEKIQQLNERKNFLASKMRPCPTEIAEEIQKRQEIVSNLEGQIDEFAMADGSGNNADIAKLARLKAYIKRLEHKNTNNGLDSLINKKREESAILESKINTPRNVIRRKRVVETRIDPKLDSEVRREQIVINPKTTESNASGGDQVVDIEDNFNACGCSTGFDGGEFDMERGSFATGDSTKPSVLSNINWKGVAIGVGVSVLLIWGAERMKLFGNSK